MNKSFKEKFRINELEVVDFKYWKLSVRPQQPTLGSLILALKRPCKNLGELFIEETNELSLVFRQIETILKTAFMYDKINYLCLMMVDGQVHFHVIPRFANSINFLNNIYRDEAWPGPPDITKIYDDEELIQNVHKELIKTKYENSFLIGYTTGVFDLFHVGHLNILKLAKSNCDYLIVGVTTDELCFSVKGKKPIIPMKERIEIVKAIKYVDEVVIQSTMDKIKAWEKLKFNIMFVGSDWKGTEKWNKMEDEFSKLNVKITYFQYTINTSSTLIREVINKKIHH